MSKRTGRPWQRVKARVIRRDNGICHLCGRSGANSADHLIPVALGGSWYDLDNLAAAHTECNNRRQTKPVGVARAEMSARKPAGFTW